MLEIKILFCSYLSPWLDHIWSSVQAWRPHFQKDIDLIEGVQRRATKLIIWVKDKTYAEILRLLHLQTLETRRVRGDLIEVLKMFKGFVNIDPCMFFRVNTAPTRSHCLKLIKPRCHLDIRKYSFAHRIVDTWNSLDYNIIACDSINGFKCKIDRFLYGRGFI